MSQVIWKFPFEIALAVTLKMPTGATILSAQMQGAVPCVWALCDPHAATEARFFEVLGTGHVTLPHDYHTRKHVATFQDGSLVWHLFELLLTWPESASREAVSHE